MVCFSCYFFSRFIIIQVVLPAALGGSLLHAEGRAAEQPTFHFSFYYTSFHCIEKISYKAPFFFPDFDISPSKCYM